MKDTHRKAGEIIATAAKPLAPALTGRLIFDHCFGTYSSARDA
jgi:hypothetical protein